MIDNQKLLVICGPTGVGKTSLAIQLAKKFNGEIVSADSRQVYKGMDIVTGKDLAKNSRFHLVSRWNLINLHVGFYEVDEVKVWLYDIVKPDYRFSVADYKECADSVIEDILNRGKLPIIVGGTGFYIRALLEGVGTMGVKPDWKLREKLQRCKVSELQRMLEETCPERMRGMNESDRKNPRRLIRAIEVANWKLEVGSGKVDREVGSEKQRSHLSLHHPVSHFSSLTSVLFVGLKAPFKDLYERIDQRVEERVKEGAEDEVHELLSKGYAWENSVLGTTIGYRELKEFLEGKTTKEDTVQKWKFAEHNYCRRQITWFKKNPGINWFDITLENWADKVEKLVRTWYS